MKVRNLLGAALAAVLCAGMAGCSGDGASAPPPSEKKQVTINVKCPPLALPYDGESGDIEAIDMLKEAGEAFCASYEDAEVTINYTRFPYTEESEAVLGSFGTENEADLVLAGQFNVPTYMHSGRAAALDDVIDEGLRADVDEAIWNQCSKDGNTYVLPFYQLQNILMVNPDLMRAAGLERFIPEDGTVAQWSTAEFDEILAGLKASMTDESAFPMALWAANNQGDTHTMSLLRSQGSTLYNAEGRFDLESPEGVAGLAWLDSLNKQAYIPKGSENLELASVIKLFENGQIAICPGNKTTMLSNYAASGSLPVAANFPTLDGKGCASTFLTGFTVFDNGDADKMNVAKDFARFIVSNDEYLRYTYSGTPVNKSYIERSGVTGEVARLDEAFVANSGNVYDFLNNTPNWSGVRDVFYLGIQDLLRGTITPEEAAATIDQTCNAAINEGYAAVGYRTM